MTDTFLFDLDGTLLQINQKEFTEAYFSELKKVFLNLGFNPETAVKSLWGGTKVMIGNDGAQTNSKRFWDYFSNAMGLSEEQSAAVEAAFDKFYLNEFNNLKSLLRKDNLELPRKMVRTLTERGFSAVLATNPLFPMSAIKTRLNWLGLVPQDFCLITDYSGSTYCKPNKGYYNEIFTIIGKEPRQCMMIGNNTVEDMCTGELGAEIFLVTDFLENETNMDISKFRHGTLNDLDLFITSLVKTN